MARKRIKEGARLRDVAAAAGVSRTTASAVVNGKAEAYGICAATRDRVEAAIRQLGYVPSQAALDMVAGRNSLVGLAVSGDKMMADRLIAFLEPALARAGFRLIVAFLPPDPQAAITRLTALDRFNLAGLALWLTGDLAIPKLSCPAIVIGNPGAGLPSVYEDETEGNRQLAGRLLDKGHRTIAIIGAATPVVSGFMEACSKSGAITRVFASAAELLGAPLSATAVFCSTPQALLELYSRCPGAGIHLGLDLAVVGADAFGMAASLTPRPTVLHPGLARLGQVAAQLLQQAIQGTASGDIRLVPVIADGDSICAPPAPRQPASSIQMPKPDTSGAAALPPQSRQTPLPHTAPVPTAPPPISPQPSRPPITPLPVPVRPPAPVTPPPAPASEVRVTAPVVPATPQRPATPSPETPAITPVMDEPIITLPQPPPEPAPEVQGDDRPQTIAPLTQGEPTSTATLPPLEPTVETPPPPMIVMPDVAPMPVSEPTPASEAAEPLPTQTPVFEPTPLSDPPPAVITPEATEATQLPEPPSESIQIPESAVPPPTEPPPEVTPEPEPAVTSEPPTEPAVVVVAPPPEPEPVAPPVVEPPPAQVVIQQPPAAPEPLADPEPAPEVITVTTEVALETQPVNKTEPDNSATIG